MEIKTDKLTWPDEANGYCVFDSQLEDDEQIFFHMTPAKNIEGIINKGFLSAKELDLGDVSSVSYCKRSSGCFANLGCKFDTDFVIFAVVFDCDQLNQVTNNLSDINVYHKNIQPKILRIINIPAGFSFT